MSCNAFPSISYHPDGEKKRQYDFLSTSISCFMDTLEGAQLDKQAI